MYVYHLNTARGPDAVVEAICLGSRGSQFSQSLWYTEFKEQNISPPSLVKKIVLYGARSASDRQS